MEHVIVNPSWTVPPSILKKEFLPALARDPFYAQRRGFNIVRRGDGISIRQPPGERNALGFIKFIFPNEHSVYLHDTPNRNLFSAERRSFSHGCIRVSEPKRLAQWVLRKDSTWTEAKIDAAMNAGKEKYVTLKNKLPVFIGYFTAWVNSEGKLNFRDDVYGHDAKLSKLLFGK
jgi:murein L,D-transpeptidase YcbB/YkuD